MNKTIGLPRFLSLEHIILEAISATSKHYKDAVATHIIIKTINDDKFKSVIGNSKNISSGTIYGTLSRLKGKQFLMKVLISDNDNEVLAYKLTDCGKIVLNEIRSTAKHAVNHLPSFTPA